MPLLNQISVLAALVLLTVFRTALAAEESPAIEQAWEKASLLLTSEAYDDFVQIRKAGKSPREADFGVALMLLNKQPKTDGNLDKAAGLFEQISESGDDDLAMLAGYFRARIEQVHRRTQNPGKAVELFTKLIERHPEHPFAQFAAVKRSMIDIYDDSPIESKRQRLAALEIAADGMTHPPAKRDMQLLIADSYVRLFQDDGQALKHLLEADAIGITRAKPRADVWLRIAELARLLGKNDVAAIYYRKFLKEFQRDNRHYTIEERLKELGAKGAAE